MKKFFLILLVVLTIVVGLVACGEEAVTVNPADPKADVSAYKNKAGAGTDMPDMISWEGLNQFKTTDEIATLYETDPQAAIAEARQLSVDFFRYCKYAQWTPADSWDFTHGSDGSKPDTLHAGVVYGGLPYVGKSFSSVYRLMDFIDPETGVVDIYKVGGENHELQSMFGNQCAQGTYQGWSRFINSAKYGGTPSMVVSNDFVILGDYVYNKSITSWNSTYGTDEVLSENTKDVLFESYALLDVGDGIVYYTSAGHVVMIASKAVVVRTEDGKIDGLQSFVTVIDQTPTWLKKNDSNGNSYDYQANVDAKWTFEALYEDHYLPFTFKEWTGEDAIEMPTIQCSHTGETISLDQIFNTKISSNYHLYDIYCSIYNADGVEVVKIATHNDYASNYEIAFASTGITSVIWGDPEALDPANYEYTVKIYAQQATGQRPTLWEGKLVPNAA